MPGAWCIPAVLPTLHPIIETIGKGPPARSHLGTPACLAWRFSVQGTFITDFRRNWIALFFQRQRKRETTLHLPFLSGHLPSLPGACTALPYVPVPWTLVPFALSLLCSVLSPVAPFFCELQLLHRTSRIHYRVVSLLSVCLFVVVDHVQLL